MSLDEASPWSTQSPVSSVCHAAGRTTLVEGQTFCIAAASGDMHAALPEGLFYLDTRVVSRWELRLNGHPLEALAVTSTEPFAATHVTRGAPAVGVADADVVVVRERHVSAGMRERITITNYGLEPVSIAARADLRRRLRGSVRSEGEQGPDSRSTRGSDSIVARSSSLTSKEKFTARS